MIHAQRVASEVRLQYIANIRLPTEKAHGAQIMKACEAFANAGVPVELIVPTRKNILTGDPFAYYGVEKKFALKRLKVLDSVSWGHLGFLLQSILFGIKVARYVRGGEGVVYGRDEIVLTLIGLLTNKKIVWESHDGAWNRWARYLAKRVRGIVVVTKGAVEFYKEKGVPETRLIAVPNGIDPKEFVNPESKEAARTRLGLPQDKIIALYIGRLDGWKGTDTLLEASRKLPLNILLAVIGGEREQVESLKKKYPQVNFLGFHPYRELSNNLAAGDILILPNTAKDQTSVQFSSPLKLFAYMTAKRPIIASDLPSIREIVDESSAIFFEPDNVESLHKAILRLAGDPEAYQSVADKAYLESKRYSWGERAQKLVSFITHI